MNQKTLIYSVLLASVLLAGVLASCEKIIDITIPDKERKIVVNGLISSGQPVRISLSKSQSVLENDSLIVIPGADVRLFKGDAPIGKLKDSAGGIYTLPGFIPEAGTTYRLTAAGGGLAPVQAFTTLPAVVPIVEVDTATLTGEWGQQELRISVKFNDPAGVTNFYGFGVEITNKVYDYNTMTYTGEKETHQAYLYGNTDRFLKEESTSFEGKLYFDDLLFDGKTKTVEFGLSDHMYIESDTVWLKVNMEQVDKPFYLHILSYNSYQQANGNPFSEPVQVYTNVEGGYGIFSGISTASYSIITKGIRKFD